MIEFISRLPQGYQEVEYIESSGTQYIVVDFIPNQDTRLDMLVEPRSVTAAASGVGFIPYGSGVNYSSNAFECYTNDGGKLEFNYDGQYKLDLLTVSVGTKINISHNKNNIVVTDTNGQTIARHSFNYMAFTCPRNLALFAINRSTALVGQTRIYSCQIYNNTTLALDLAPCYRKSDNVAGLYDLVNNVFYTNVGSGVFAVGADSNKHATATIIPGGVLSFGAALRRRLMLNVKSGLSISGLPLGALIRAEDGGNGAANYEIVGFDIFSPGDCVLTRKTKYTTASYGSITKYADSSIDKRCNGTIYNAFSADLRAKIMDVVFYLASDGQITRKVFVPTATMVGNGGNEGVAFPYFNSDERRAKGEEWWTSTIYTKDYMRVVRNDGYITIGLMRSSYTGVVPTFVIPASTRYDPVPNDDGSYNLVL